MGGLAFANAYARGQPSLRVRRITSAEYEPLVQIWRTKVQAFFNCPLGQVQSPIPAPEKASYGDVDILVGYEGDVDWLMMATELGAVAVIKRGHKACSIAVSPRGNAHKADTVLYIDCQGERSKLAESLSEEEYIQVDVGLVEPRMLHWTCFADSYGDTAIILGYIISRFGFTQNDKGFWLRVKEIDDSKAIPYLALADRDGMISLTTSPTKLMDFLGLSVERYNASFQTMDEFYEWLSKCRFLFPHLLNDKDKTADQIRRERKRPIYTDFFFRWLPDHSKACTTNTCIKDVNTVDEARAEILQLALDYFDVKEQYEAARQRVLEKWHHGQVVQLLRQLLRDVTGRNDEYVSLVIRGMRRYIVFVDGEKSIDLEPHADKESQLTSFLDSSKQQLRSPNELRFWLGKHHAELRSLGKSKHKPVITIE